jgi:hypothetical protein
VPLSRSTAINLRRSSGIHTYTQREKKAAGDKRNARRKLIGGAAGRPGVLSLALYLSCCVPPKSGEGPVCWWQGRTHKRVSCLRKGLTKHCRAIFVAAIIIIARLSARTHTYTHSVCVCASPCLVCKCGGDAQRRRWLALTQRSPLA